LKEMPLMKTFKEDFHLKETLVNYCAFGPNYPKPTNLWTNDNELSTKLSTCKCRCGRGNHEGSVQHEKHLDHAFIPENLAYIVAKRIDTKFWDDGVQDHPAQTP